MGLSPEEIRNASASGIEQAQAEEDVLRDQLDTEMRERGQ